MWEEADIYSRLPICVLVRERERERDFSLDFREIRMSKSIGPRRKAVLRGAGNEWTPV